MLIKLHHVADANHAEDSYVLAKIETDGLSVELMTASFGEKGVRHAIGKGVVLHYKIVSRILYEATQMLDQAETFHSFEVAD